MKAFNQKFIFIALGLFSAFSSYAQNQNLPPVVWDASEYYIRGCEVKLNVNGMYNQLYLNGQFSGNFQIRAQDNLLAQTIYTQLQRGVCNYKSENELQYLRDPNLIDAFAHHQYQNCSVNLYVDRYHQLYIRNVFRGNYVAGFEDAKLRSVLAANIVNGTCVSIYNPPQPQGCTCTLNNQWGSFISVGPNCNVAVIQVVNQCANSNPHAVCSASQAYCR